MKSFPMFFRTTGRRIVVVGGGEQAAQKARLVLKTDAEIVLAAPELDDELAGLVAAGRARHDTAPLAPASFRGAALVFVATGCPGLDACAHALAREAGAVVNVVDQPALCDVTTPSIVDRDPVVVAIGTEGTAPVLSRRIKTEIEARLDPRLGAFAALAGRLREGVARRIPREERRAFWHWAFSDAPWHAHKRGAAAEAARLLKHAIAAGGSGAPATGQIALVGAGPGARDLLTLRAVERLQEADVIFYDRLVDPEVLELARRDAERVFVGKVVGASDWPQERINDLVVQAARRGRRVVRLKSGDPSIFGRAGEESAAARAAGIPVEIVPGVTAASAVAASTGRSLTERDVTDCVVFATGTCRPGADDPNWGRMAAPGTSLVLYMAVHRASEIRASLLAAGCPADAPVEIVTRVSRMDEVRVACQLADLEATIAREGVESPSVIVVRHAKRARAAASPRAALARVGA